MSITHCALGSFVTSEVGSRLFIIFLLPHLLKTRLCTHTIILESNNLLRFVFALAVLCSVCFVHPSIIVLSSTEIKAKVKAKKKRWKIYLRAKVVEDYSEYKKR